MQRMHSNELRVIFHDADSANLCFSENGERNVLHQKYYPDYDRSLRMTTDLTQKLSSKNSLKVDGYDVAYFVQEDLFHRIFVPLVKYESLLAVICRFSSVKIEKCPSNLLRLLCHEDGKDIIKSDQTLLAALRNSRRYISTAILESFLIAVNCIMLMKFSMKRDYLLLYSIDQVTSRAGCDFRIEGVYQEINRRKIEYVEFFHTSSHKLSLKNIFKRGRAGVVMESSIMSFIIRKTMGIDGKVKKFLDDVNISIQSDLGFNRYRHILMNILGTSYSKYILMKVYTKLLNPVLSLIVDDGRHANELVASLKNRNCLCIGFQHGLTFNKYFVGLCGYKFNNHKSHAFDLYGFWSNYFQKKMIRISDLYEDSNTFVFGMIRENSNAASINDVKRGERIRVLIISEPKLSKDCVRRFMEKISECQNFEISIRIRPGEDLSIAKSIYGDIWSRASVKSQNSLKEDLSSCDVVLGAYSSVLYEAIFLMKPVVMIETENIYKAHDLHENGLVTLCGNPGNICYDILEAAALTESELQERKIAVWGGVASDGCSILIEKSFKELEERRTRIALVLRS